MHNKGQIASLDFILSVILVVVALGLTMQIIETNQYTMKEMEVYNELARIGETAADILVSHPDFTCDLSDELNNQIGELQNCLHKKNLTLTKEKMGILDGAEGYKCRIEIINPDGSGGSIGLLTDNPCKDNDPSADAYSTTRRIVYVQQGWGPGGIGNGSYVFKSKLIQECMTNSPQCKLKEKIMTLTIWKA